MGLGISAHAPAKVLSAKVPVMGEGWGEVEEEIRPHCAAMSQLPVLATPIISGEDDHTYFLFQGVKGGAKNSSAHQTNKNAMEFIYSVHPEVYSFGEDCWLSLNTNLAHNVNSPNHSRRK